MKTLVSYLYRLVLRTYPRSFREELSSQMTADFLSLMAEQKSGSRRFLVGLRDLANVALSGTGERWRRRRRVGGHEPTTRTGLGDLSKDLAHDLRFATRFLLRRPAFSLTAVCALALGIGASTAVFGLADVAWLRGLPPYLDADRVVTVWRQYVDPDGARSGGYWSWSDFDSARRGASAFIDLALYTPGEVPVTGLEDYPVVVPVGEATPSLSAVLGIRPEIGRWFLPDEEGPEPHDVVVLGHRFWQERLGADPGVIGSDLLLDGHPFTVIGVVPSSFRYRESVEAGERGLVQPTDDGERALWLPLSHSLKEGGYRFRAQHFGAFEAVARLKPGVSSDVARREVFATQQYADLRGHFDVHVERRARLELAGIPTKILLLALPSTLLLLLACANVATLLVGEAIERRAELATRFALGAGRGHIVRQLLAESVVLGLAGSAAGTLVAVLASRLLASSVPVSSVAHQLGFSTPMLFVACGTGVAAGLAFGVVPALMLAGSAGGRVYGQMRARGPGRRIIPCLIALQVAATCVLLVTGGLFIRTVRELHNVDLGFEPAGLVSLRANLIKVPPAQRAPAVARFMEEAQGNSEVEEATGSWSIPMVTGLFPRFFEVEDPSAPGGLRTVEARWDVVMPGFHRTLGVPLLRGRFFTNGDRPDAPRVSVVSSAAADLLWPGRDPVGERVRLSGDSVWTVVVGVIGGVRYEGYEQAEPAPVVYQPYAQEPQRHGARFTLTARIRGAAGAVARSLEGAARSADPGILVEGVEMVDVNLKASTTDQRVRALLILLFGLGATGLAAVGIGGVSARSVSQRSRDLAVRYALGADDAKLRRTVLRETLAPGMVGVAGGLLLAMWAGRLVAHFLFGVQAWDLATFGTVTVLLLCCSPLSGYAPTRSILRDGPSSHLKAD